MKSGWPRLSMAAFFGLLLLVVGRVQAFDLTKRGPTLDAFCSLDFNLIPSLTS